MPTMTGEPVVGVQEPPGDGPGFVAWVRPHLVAMARSPRRMERIGAAGGVAMIGIGARLAVSGRPD